MGLSFILCAIFFRHWLTEFAETMALISKDDVSVDAQNDMNALMSKLDFFYKWLPDWMRLLEDGREILDRAWSDRRRFYNRRTASAIFGYGATKNTMTGGRVTAIGKDEFAKFKAGDDKAALASTQHTTNCRYFVSTYWGNSNEFFRLMDNKDSEMLKIVVDWKDNPERSRGMYSSVKGELQIIDHEYWTEERIERYNFILDGKTRSPWYDKEWRRPGATPRSIAEELDRDPRGSVAKFFSQESFGVQRKHTLDPRYTGFFDYDLDDLSEVDFCPSSNGQVRIWMPLTRDWEPVGYGPYSMGVDIAAGAGGDYSSNSSIEVIDIGKKEQVLEFYSPTIRPEKLGRLVAAIANWLSRGRSQESVYIVPEMNVGVSEAFREELMDVCKWQNIYIRKQTGERKKKKTKKLGYWNSDRGAQILEQLDSAMFSERFISHSEVLLHECSEYEWRKDKLVHVRSHMSEEDGMTGAAHADCAIAAALAWHGVLERPKPKTDRAKAREVEQREEREHARSMFDNRSFGDVWTEYADQAAI